MIEATVSGEVFSSNGVIVDHPVVAAFQYDDKDPFAVGVLFQWEMFGVEAEQYWEFSRDLLREMYDKGAAGDGDVMLALSGLTDRIAMTVVGLEGTSVISLDAEELRKFASSIYRLVPNGRENMDDQIDEAIEWILENQ